MKKRKITGVLAVFMIMVISLAFSAFGADEVLTYKDFSYIVRDNNTVQITKYNGTNKNVTVPSKIDGMAVTVIGSHTFSVCSELRSLTIPGTVADLQECAVSYCPKLESLIIKDGSLKTLDYMDIYSCQQVLFYDFNLRKLGLKDPKQHCTSYD